MRGSAVSWFETAQERLLTMRESHLSIDAFDPCDDGFGAQLGDNSAEMLQVIDLKIDGELCEILRASEHADIVDIAVVLGNHGGHLGQASGLVDVVDEDPRRKPLGRRIVDIPAHVEPALRLLLEILQRRRLDRIDLHALARGDDPDAPAASLGRVPFGFAWAYSFLARANSRSGMGRRRPAYGSRTAVRVARRIAARALPVTASDSHADGGADWASEVRTSTSSPFCSSDDSGANLPLILQPTALLPTSVCTA